ncbi:hypothetical protein KUTeg_025025 [Tegillarca granosa]|uniref:VWFA domain-containing protein n=1 Tax=Tegillarca granosa TaxID=220873 RepID=A0ABQ9DZJ9_TEGGR|nr:hypothetical protein KUTeg_025025 [Tegillarca granosa]
MTEILAVDPYRLNAYSNSVSFDLGFKDMYTKTIDVPQKEEEYNPEVSMKKTPCKEWELDVRALISTKKWLMNYGLKRNKLTLKQLLPVIGFKLSDDYDRTLKKPVSSKYANGLFNQVYRPDGKTFNITCSREKLKVIEGRLIQAIQLYKRRLDWLTSESRRVFGVIEERALTVVLDIRNMSPQQFDQYRIAFEKVIYEQLTQVAKFNLIRAADDMQLYQPECVPVTHDTIGGANEAVYLFTEGTSIETCKEILHEKVLALKEKIPVHVVSYNCDSSDTVRSLREFTRKTGSKFHAYAVIMEMDSYEGQPVDPKTNRANIVLKKKTFGGIPPGAGMRDDVVLLFEELEEARNILSSLQAVSQDIPEPKIQTESKINKAIQSADRDEQYMGSKEWLVKYGLHARGLEMFDILSGVAFKHEDGVVDVRKVPPNNTQTDSVSHAKLVNAKYCDKFPVVKWKDGRCVHVQVTPELHRHYEQKIKIAMNVFQQRIDWLNQGSRALFGTVIEDQIYIIIDTSASMLPSIQFLKEKLFVLMQEQLRHKMKVNFVSFNSKAVAWQNRLVEVDEHSLQSAWKWIQNLSCWGSTNTYAALQIALSDPSTQAIYLLTDGRPDQPPKSIIAQVQMQHCVPVHSISFNL